MIIFINPVINETIKCLNEHFAQKKEVFIHIAEGYDTIETPTGIGFGVFVPETQEIFVAGDMPEPQCLITTIAHEYKHFIQYCENRPYSEEEAEEFAETVKVMVLSKLRPDCNKCKHLNVTEAKQPPEKLPHICGNYGKRVFHRTNKAFHSPYLYPCNECENDFWKNYEEVTK